MVHSLLSNERWLLTCAKSAGSTFSRYKADRFCTEPAMPSKSAGIIAYRKRRAIEILLVHPGGPFWRNKDLGAWSIPKGEYADEEDAETAARREFAEELGFELSVPLIALGEVKQRGGKLVTAFAAELDIDVHSIHSNTFEMEWPPRSSKRQVFPEVDRAEWFTLEEAREKINAGQRPLLDRLAQLAGGE
ncbi:putative NUDIX family NTP pyrophosphohydrolase [Bradyrhizobium ottawaense]|uniref:NUDIX family NTP pyrophosphohydrolase n=2 Tax=Bradyrhizobium ottawaense TaxID=931866 RepID=A0ABV4FYY8_9BRAD